MTPTDITKRISELIEQHSAHVIEYSRTNQNIPDKKTCLQYEDVNPQDPIAANYRYEVGYLRQPTSSMPSARVFYVSREGGLGMIDPQLVVFSDSTTDARVLQGELRNAVNVIGLINNSDLDLVLRG